MVKLLKKRRKSKVLTPSQLRCLSKIPTVNITSGCAHGCIYCYTKGYSQYPGDDQVVLFTDTAEKIAGELLRRRNSAVYARRDGPNLGGAGNLHVSVPYI